MLDANWLVAFTTLLNDSLHDLDDALSPSARAMLLSVEHRQPITVSALAKVLAISQPTATRLADGLERAGLMHRGAKADRAVPLMLTAAGRTRAGAVQAAMQERAAGLLDALTPAERRDFTGAVAKLLAAGTDSRETARTICRYCDHAICNAPDCPVDARASELERPGSTQASPC